MLSTLIPEPAPFVGTSFPPMYSSLALITIALCHPALSISVVPDTFFPDIATSFQVIVVEPSLLLVISAPSASN